MAVFNLFSKRKAAQLGQLPELQSAELPRKFRVQIAQLLMDTIGKWFDAERHMPPGMIPRPSNDAWVTIYQRVCREHGLFVLGDTNDNPAMQCLNYLLGANTDSALDLIESALRYIDEEIRHADPYAFQSFTGIVPQPDAAIREFNTRCRENGVGYSFTDGIIVPVSSTYIHTEVVEPALRLLHQEEFSGAQEEFLNAHRHLRGGDYKNAIVEANKAFESTMKTICGRCGWAFESGAPAKQLINVLLKNGFVPSYLETQIAQLRGLLETGVPVVRNKDGAHGQGEVPVQVPRELAEYALHLTAANIVFLVKLMKK